MQKIYVKDLKLNQMVNSYFIVFEKEIRLSQNQNEFMQILIGDKTGKIGCKAFDDIDYLNSILKISDVIQVNTNVSEFPIGSGKIQMILNGKNIKKLSENEFDKNELIMTTNKNILDMKNHILENLLKTENEYLKKLALLFFNDKIFMDKFCSLPAAKVHHHTYFGGLLEHTHSVFKLCENLAENYQLDRDLMLFGAFIHDIGKIKDYDMKVNIEMTDSGGLVGHIIWGVELLNKKIDEIEDFPEKLKLKLIHIIISHHGNGEWGSPINPRFKESFAIHLADHLDSNLFDFINLQDQEKQIQKDSKWSSYIRKLDRKLFLD